MSIFTSSPTDGDIVTDGSGMSWKYVASTNRWELQGAGASASMPFDWQSGAVGGIPTKATKADGATAVAEGDMFWDTTANKLYSYDSTTSAWVAVGGASGAMPYDWQSAAAAPTLRSDGSGLTAGDLYYNTATGNINVYRDGTDNSGAPAGWYELTISLGVIPSLGIVSGAKTGQYALGVVAHNNETYWIDNTTSGTMILRKSSDGMANITNLGSVSSDFGVSLSISPDGSKVGFTGRISGQMQVFISADSGANFTNVTSSFIAAGATSGTSGFQTRCATNNTRAVCWSVGGMWYSDNSGATWSACTTPALSSASTSVYQIVWNQSNSEFVACVDQDVWVSPDGITWTLEVSNATVGGGIEHFARLGTTLVVSPYNSPLQVSYNNGGTWSTVGAPVNANIDGHFLNPSISSYAFSPGNYTSQSQQSDGNFVLKMYNSGNTTEQFSVLTTDMVNFKILSKSDSSEVKPIYDGTYISASSSSDTLKSTTAR